MSYRFTRPTLVVSGAVTPDQHSVRPVTSDRPESHVRPRRFLHLRLCPEPNPPIGSFACVLT